MAPSTTYLKLAPTNLVSYRSFRYDGGGFDIKLQELSVEDVSLIAQIYSALKSIYDLWLYMGGQPNYPLLRNRLEQFATAEFLTKVQSIGSATYAAKKDSEHLHSAIHDIRGGALTSLTGYARLLPQLPDEIDFVRQAVYLARDHAKMMRNILPDLDAAVREADEGLKLHAITEFVDKWDGFIFELPNKKVTVEANSMYDGFVTSRCLETSAVDRILYNFINNAARFTADEAVKFTVFPVGEGLIRWVVENKITADQKKWLKENVGEDFSVLYKGGITRGGHGRGLANCANFVATSFGIDTKDALEDGYLGAAIKRNVYYAWFHWPAYVPQSEDEPVCDCGDH